MEIVNKKEFTEYFKNKNYTIKQGNCFHCDIFIVDNEEVGYRETSSWSRHEIYKLKYGSTNYEAISFVSDFIWAKENGKL